MVELKFVKVTCGNSKEVMYLNVANFLAIRANSQTKGSSVLLTNGMWLEVQETIQEFHALVEDRDPTVANLLFNADNKIN